MKNTCLISVSVILNIILSFHTINAEEPDNQDLIPSSEYKKFEVDEEKNDKENCFSKICCLKNNSGEDDFLLKSRSLIFNTTSSLCNSQCLCFNSNTLHHSDSDSDQNEFSHENNGQSHCIAKEKLPKRLQFIYDPINHCWDFLCVDDFNQQQEAGFIPKYCYWATGCWMLVSIPVAIFII